MTKPDIKNLEAILDSTCVYRNPNGGWDVYCVGGMFLRHFDVRDWAYAFAYNSKTYKPHERFWYAIKHLPLVLFSIVWINIQIQFKKLRNWKLQNDK